MSVSPIVHFDVSHGVFLRGHRCNVEMGIENQKHVGMNTDNTETLTMPTHKQEGIEGHPIDNLLKGMIVCVGACIEL